MEIHSFFGVSSVWKVFGVSLRMFGHFSNLAACISSMECIDSNGVDGSLRANDP